MQYTKEYLERPFAERLLLETLARQRKHHTICCCMLFISSLLLVLASFKPFFE